MPLAPVKGLAQRFDALAFFFNAAGRSGRTGALIGVFAVVVLMQPLQLLPRGWPHALYAWAVGFLAFVVWGTVMARRLHDLGLAGWWVAPLFALAGLATLTAPHAAGLGAGFAAPAGAMQVALLLWPGGRGFNRFGPPPA